jgi:histidyl-tRNA synthetase
MKTLGGVKGFHDIVPPESERFTALEHRLRDVLRSYNYDEIRVPIAERTDLFARSLGETTDIVEKEMYTFEDRDGTSLTLRPEGTASVVRAAIDAGLAQRERVAKLYYMGPMFRRERPQRGRSAVPHGRGADRSRRSDRGRRDGHVVRRLSRGGGCPGVAHRVQPSAMPNAARRIGGAHGRRRGARTSARTAGSGSRNPLRLDCKEESARDGRRAAVTDQLCAACRTHFDAVQALPQPPAELRPQPAPVRGLDYYVHRSRPWPNPVNAVGGGGATMACGGARRPPLPASARRRRGAAAARG